MTAPAITAALAMVGRQPNDEALMAVLEALDSELDPADEDALMALEAAIQRLEGRA